MLTADLVRVSVRKGTVTPRYIDPACADTIARAEAVVAIYAAHANAPRAALDDALQDLVGEETAFGVTRGFAKLCDDRATWETVAPIDPIELRRHVFLAAADAHPIGTRRSTLHPTTRDDVLRAVGETLGVSREVVETALYADLKAEQRMTAWRPIAPTALIHRYNVALAQGIVLRAHALQIRVAARAPKRVRQVFRVLKFHQLMHQAERDGAEWVITVDGPMSLFHQSQRYGVQLANLLPAVLLTEGWRIEAEVDWFKSGERLAFALSPDDGLVSPMRSRATWQSQEEKTLIERLSTHRSGWRAERRAMIVNLDGRGVLVPDLVLHHTPSGREALLDIVGFWRRGYLERRAELLRAHGPANLILCVSRRLRAGDDDAALSGPGVIDFAEVISTKRLIEAAEAVATVPD